MAQGQVPSHGEKVKRAVAQTSLILVDWKEALPLPIRARPVRASPAVRLDRAKRANRFLAESVARGAKRQTWKAPSVGTAQLSNVDLKIE